MYISIFIIIFNLFLFYLFNIKKKAENEYIKEKYIYNKYKLREFIKYLNIGYITVYLLYYLIIALNIGLTSIKYSYIHIILFIINVLLFIFFYNTSKINIKRLNLIDKKINDDNIMLTTLTFLVLFIIEKTRVVYEIVGEDIIEKYDFINNFNVILKGLSIVIILISSILLLKKIINNRDKCLYSYNKEHYLEDAKFYDRLDIKKGLNHFIYITAFVVFFYINIPYIYFFYILLSFLLIYLIYKKYKKIINESDRLYKNVALLNNKPGIIYPFQFIRDVLLLRKMILILIILVFSTILYYGLGESVFSYTAVSMYIVLLNVIIDDKIYLIRYLASLNEKFIDKKKYSISINKKINYIDIIEIFKIKLYKLIIIDTITYESNIIIYDPEYRINEINIRVNKSNIDDYIIYERELYEE